MHGVVNEIKREQQSMMYSFLDVLNARFNCIFSRSYFHECTNDHNYRSLTIIVKFRNIYKLCIFVSRELVSCSSSKKRYR